MKHFLAAILALALMITSAPVSSFAAAEYNASESSQTAQSAERSDSDECAEAECLPCGAFELVRLEDIAEDQPVAAATPKKRSLRSQSAGSDEAEIRKMPLLVIVAGFKDTPYDNEYDWGETLFSEIKEDWSLSRYFSDNSNGSFTFAPALESSEYYKNSDPDNADAGSSAHDEQAVTNIYDGINDGIVHVTLDMDHGEWADIAGSAATWSQKESWRAALSGALAAADQYVDFRQYDANGNGRIDTNEMAVGFIIAGGEASNSDNLEKTDPNYLTWAHASRMSAYMNAPVCDGVAVDNYIAMAEDADYLRYTVKHYTEDEAAFYPFTEDWAEEAVNIALNKRMTVNTAVKAGLFRFTPSKAGWYAFYSKAGRNGSDPAGRVLDAGGMQVAYNDDNEDDEEANGQFRVVFYAEKGAVYYLQAKNIDGDESFYVYIEQTTEPESEEPEDEEDFDFSPFSKDWEASASRIYLNDNKTVASSAAEALYKFIPMENGWFAFYSGAVDEKEDDPDPVGRVLDYDGNRLVYDDDIDGDDNCHFRAVFYGEAGKAYYLQAGEYDSERFTVGIEKTEKPDGAYDPEDDQPAEYLYKRQAGIGIMAHELGHYLGLADYYDVDHDGSGAWSDYEVGDISVMAWGNWCCVEENGKAVYRPCDFDAYSRIALGWDDPLLADEGGSYKICSLGHEDDTGCSILKVETGRSDEYYLIENRQFEGWDSSLRLSYPKHDTTGDDDDETAPDYGSLAETGGLVIWHVDEGIISRYKSENKINSTDHRPGLMPLYMEYDSYPEFRSIAGIVDKRKLFFDGQIYADKYSSSAGEMLFLPIYSNARDIPDARTPGSIGISFEGSGSSVTVGITGSHEHDIIEIEEVPASCEKCGLKAHYECSLCKKLFNKYGGNYSETTRVSLSIPKGEHIWVDGICTVCGADDPSIGPSEADKKAAAAVIAAIDAIPDTVKASDESKVLHARELYDALTDIQKELVGESGLDILNRAEKSIGYWKEYKAAASKAKAKKVKRFNVRAKRSRKAKASWSKTPGVSGYQIKYSGSRKFKRKATKTITVKGRKKKARTIKKLKRRKNYYFRIRPYTNVRNKATGKTVRICGKWSKIRRIRAR